MTTVYGPQANIFLIHREPKWTSHSQSIEMLTVSPNTRSTPNLTVLTRYLNYCKIDAFIYFYESNNIIESKEEKKHSKEPFIFLYK